MGPTFLETCTNIFKSSGPTATISVSHIGNPQDLCWEGAKIIVLSLR